MMNDEQIIANIQKLRKNHPYMPIFEMYYNNFDYYSINFEHFKKLFEKSKKL